MGKATERIFLPMLKALNPEIVDIDLPWEGVFHNCVIVSMKKRYPMHARKLMNSLWGTGQMSFSKMVLTVDETINVHNYKEVVLNLLNNLDIERDIHITDGILDVLDHSSPNYIYGSKVGVDATKRIEGENKRKEINYNEMNINSEELKRVLKNEISDILDINIPLKDVKNRVILISIKKNKPYHSRVVAERFFNSIPSHGRDYRIVVVLDDDVDANDISTAIWKLFNNVDPKRDFYFIDGKLTIDATKKLAEERHPRDWPPEIIMDEEVKERIYIKFPQFNVRQELLS